MLGWGWGSPSLGSSRSLAQAPQPALGSASPRLPRRLPITIISGEVEAGRGTGALWGRSKGVPYLMVSCMSFSDRSASSNSLRAFWAAGEWWEKIRVGSLLPEAGRWGGTWRLPYPTPAPSLSPLRWARGRPLLAVQVPTGPPPGTRPGFWGTASSPSTRGARTSCWRQQEAEEGPLGAR